MGFLATFILSFSFSLVTIVAKKINSKFKLADGQEMYKVQRTCKAIVFLVQPFVSHVLVADVFLICMSLRIKE